MDEADSEQYDLQLLLLLLRGIRNHLRPVDYQCYRDCHVGKGKHAPTHVPPC